VAAGVLTDVDPGHEYAPFMYRRVTVFQPLTGDVTVHARFLGATGRGRRPVDFDILDTASHALLLRAESFVIREVPDGFDAEAEPDGRAGSVAPDGSSSGPETALPQATVAAPEGDADPDAPPAWLLLPEDGAAAFLDALRPGRPPVVLVDLPGQPLEVPGIPWADPALPHLPPAPGGPPAQAPEPAPDPSIVDDVVPRPVPVAPAQAAVAPAPDGDEVVAQLRQVWGDALGVTELSLDDDFFELGGDSLSAVQVAARISARFGVEISAGSLFDTPTLRALTEEVRSQTGALAGSGAR
jgi:phthiocerol/phenolphthiocerol synthesis type-I polyketide synthase E